MLINFYIFLVCVYSVFSLPTYVAACCTTTEVSRCCNDSCIKIDDKSRNFCILKAQELQTCGSGYINNALIRNLHVLTNNNTNGTLVADNINLEGAVNINGTITVDGEDITQNTINQYAYITLTIPQTPLGATAIIPFDSLLYGNGITNAAGVVTFSEAGIYMVNYTISINAGVTQFRLIYDPAGAQTPVTDTLYYTAGTDTQLSGLTIIEIPTPGTTIGLQNNTGVTRIIDSVSGLPNVLATLSIIKLSDL